MISACTVAASLDHRAQHMDGAPANKILHLYRWYTHTDAFTHRIFFTEHSLRRAVCTHRSFTQRGLSTKQRLHHTQIFYEQRVFASGFYTEKLLHRERHREAVTHKGFYTDKSFCRAAFTRFNFTEAFDIYEKLRLALEITILLHFWTLDHHFARKGCVCFVRNGCA